MNVITTIRPLGKSDILTTLLQQQQQQLLRQIYIYIYEWQAVFSHLVKAWVIMICHHNQTKAVAQRRKKKLFSYSLLAYLMRSLEPYLRPRM